MTNRINLRAALFFFLLAAILLLLFIAVNGTGATALGRYSIVETATAIRLTHLAQTHTSTPTDTPTQILCDSCGTRIGPATFTPTPTDTNTPTPSPTAS